MGENWILDFLRRGQCPLCNKVCGINGLYNHLKESKDWLHHPERIHTMLHDLVMLLNEREEYFIIPVKDINVQELRLREPSKYARKDAFNVIKYKDRFDIIEGFI